MHGDERLSFQATFVGHRDGARIASQGAGKALVGDPAGVGAATIGRQRAATLRIVSPAPRIIADGSAHVDLRIFARDSLHAVQERRTGQPDVKGQPRGPGAGAGYRLKR